MRHVLSPFLAQSVVSDLRVWSRYLDQDLDVSVSQILSASLLSISPLKAQPTVRNEPSQLKSDLYLPVPLNISPLEAQPIVRHELSPFLAQSVSCDLMV